MGLKTNIKAVKAKAAVKKAKEAVVDLCGDIKGISITLDFENKKHTIELQTK